MRGEHDSTTLAKPDTSKSLALAESPKDDLVAVLEKPTLLAARKRDGFSPAPRKLQQTTAGVLRWTGHRPARDEVAG